MDNENELGEKRKTKTWVDSLGFQFDPFIHLNAADDSHLGEYVVDLKKYVGAWENYSSLIFAPAGGGKTTLRIYAYRTLWVGRDGLHPFPIQYYLPLITDNVNWAETIESDLTQAAANALLLSLSFRPEHLKHITVAVQEEIVAFLSASIGRNILQHYLVALEKELNPMILAEQIDRAYALPDLPTPASVKVFCSALFHSLSKKSVRENTPDPEPIDSLCRLIIQKLQFNSIHVLIDGIDGFADSVNDPQKASEQVNLLLKKTEKWARKGIYIKIFLPKEMEKFIETNLSKSHIVWAPDSLAKVIEQRIMIASGGRFGSLNGVSGPGLRNEHIEKELAQNVIPLPREIIVAVKLLFEAYERRSKGMGKIEPEDLDTAFQNYRKDLKRRQINLSDFVDTAYSA